MGDVSVEGSDINSRHDGVGSDRQWEGPNDLKEIIGVFHI